MALENVLFAFSTLHEENGGNGMTEATLRLLKDSPPEQDVRGITREQWIGQIRRWLEK